MMQKGCPPAAFVFGDFKNRTPEICGTKVNDKPLDTMGTGTLMGAMAE
jgi:hypothetical protein